MSDGVPRKSDSTTPAAAWWLFGLLGIVLVLLSLLGESWTSTLRYDRAAVMAGELWRLVTGHLVHGSVRHLLLNVGGVVLMALLLARDYSPAAWILILVGSLATIDVAFVFWEPQVEWYVGLSGVLHGVLAAGAVAWWRNENRALALALTAVLVGKVGWEYWRGALPFAGLPVVVDAHLYGAIGGALAGAAIQFRRSGWPFRPRSL